MAGGRLLALDGMRGVAAIGVMAMHAQLAALPVPGGYLAVDLFFLLSGFVIARSYEPQLQSGAMGFGAYALVRLERLYPMLALGGLFGLALYLAGLSPFVAASTVDLTLAIIAQFLLVPFIGMEMSFAFNGAQWSIVLELLANFFHAIALPRLGNRMLAAIVALSALGLLLAGHRFGNLNVGWSRTSFLYGLPRVGFGFLGGVLLHRTQDRWLAIVPCLPFAVLALAFAIVVNLPTDFLPYGDASAAFDCGVVLLLFPPLVMLAIKAEGGRWAAMLGSLSFPLYAMHYQLMAALHVVDAAEWAKWLAMALLLPAAWAIGVGIDEPLNRWRRRSRKAAAAARSEALFA